jgi:hypothetical protein
LPDGPKRQLRDEKVTRLWQFPEIQRLFEIGPRRDA